MNDRLSELKVKQAEIGDKISLLQATNKKKDEEAAEIRQLIAECRENLNRIKGVTNSYESAPCQELEESKNLLPTNRENGDDTSGKNTNRRESEGAVAPRGSMECPEKRAYGADKRPHSELFGKKNDSGPEEEKKNKKKKGRDKDKVSCKVDLNKMRVRIRGPSEDLKKLDATQLICLLEKYQCQELIINTGNEFIQDPGEIRLLYLLHPGNVVMMVGIVMIAFLLKSNLFNEYATPTTKFLFNILYLGSFAFHYGMVLWMSFVRGFALKFGLNQDMFHQVDNLILPKYYSLSVLLSALSLYSFLASHCPTPYTSWPLEVVAQMILEVVTFIMELITICYIIPAVIKLRQATDEYIIDDEEQEQKLPESYEKNMIKLGKLSRTICLINFLTLLFLGANIYYITSKLNLSGGYVIPPKSL